MRLKHPEYLEAFVVRAFDEYSEKRYDEAARLLGEALAIDPRSEVALLLRADVWMETNHSRLAIRDLDLLLQHHRDSLPAYFRRAAIHLSLGQRRAALRNYSAILDRDAVNVAALHLRAALLVDTRQLDKALTDLDRLLRIDPDHVEGRIDRGYVRFMLGDLNGSRGDLEMALDSAHVDDASSASASRLLRHIQRLQQLPIRRSG